jgi:adenylate cyclase
VALAWAYDVGPEGVQRTRSAAAIALDAPADALPESGVDPSDATIAPAGGPANRAVPRSIAILPFVDLSRERDQEYLGDGIGEEILNVLAQVDGLQVAARTSAFAFKGRNIDVREIGRQLGVEAVLEGSVRTAGQQLRVTAQLINVGDGYHLWSRRFDRSLGDVFAVQDEIAAEIASALDLEEPTLGVSDRAATKNLEAYEYYLRGRQFFHRKTRRALRVAEQMFRRALQADPEYAPAHAGLADTCSFLFMYYDASDENLRCADEGSSRALGYGADVPEAHVSRGLALSLTGRYPEAEQEFGRAVELNPRSFDGYYFHARAMWAAGDQQRAAELFLRAAEIQPESYDTWALLAGLLRGLGREEESRDAQRRGAAAAERALEFSPDDVRALYLGAGCLLLMGDEERGLEWADRAAATDPDDASVHYNLACFYSLVAGKAERALDHLHRALDLGYAQREWIENDADLDSLRDHPRYAQVIARLTHDAPSAVAPEAGP